MRIAARRPGPRCGDGAHRLRSRLRLSSRRSSVAGGQRGTAERGSKVSVTITDVSATEGNWGTKAFSFTVQASGSLKGSASVAYRDGDGTAGAPNDYTQSSGSLSFDRRVKTRTVTVQVVGDTIDEVDETFQVLLSSPSGATLADGVGVGTIVDDDSPPVTGTRIAAAGDIACDPSSASFNGGQGSGLECRQQATSDLLVGSGYDAVLVLGDIQYEDGAYSKFLASYDRSWGRVKAITKPAPGNHEYQSGSAADYYRYFGTAAGDPTKGYYSYDIGGWHIVALNSNCSFVGGCGAGSPQEQWLSADLAAHPANCTLAYWHHPRFSSGEHGSDSTYTASGRRCTTPTPRSCSSATTTTTSGSPPRRQAERSTSHAASESSWWAPVEGTCGRSRASGRTARRAT